MDFEIDVMMFFQTVVDDQVEIALGLPAAAEMTFGISGVTITGEPSMFSGIAKIAHAKAAEAQAELDALIEADDTWRPA
jgi:hypothetical protein